MNTRGRRNANRCREITPAGVPLRLRLRTGEAILRWLRSEDTERLLVFFATHTPETVHERYGYAFKAMTLEEARRLVSVDPMRDVALGIFEGSGPDCELIAIGRYCLAADGQSAEAAFVVREDRRCQGLATLLLRALLSFAAARGVRRLVASVQHDNTPMLAVFRRAAATFKPGHETAGFDVTIELPQSSDPRTTSGPPKIGTTRGRLSRRRTRATSAGA